MSIDAGRGWLAAALILAVGSVAWAARPSSVREDRQTAEQLVQEALHREIYGMEAERARLLEKAAQLAPDYAPAMWHRGYVRMRNQWVRLEDYCQQAGQDPRLVAYRRIRADYPNTAEGQLALADWCRKRGLVDQERAHLAQVIQLEPDHAEARHRLGFRRINGVWMQLKEIEASIQQLQAERKALAAWRSEIEQIRQGLHHRSPRRRSSAQQRLLAITDPAALVAMEQILARDSQQSARLVIEVASKMPQQEAALCLARLAVLSPWEDVREEAARRLRDRPADSYIPSLLGNMYSPVRSQMVVAPGPRGRLLYRHSFYREGQDENQLLVLDTAYRRIARLDGDRRETLERALQQIANTAMEAERAVAEQNRRTVELNRRISEALSIATRQVLPNDPDAWWQWWNEYNEVFVQGQKQTRTVHQQRQIEIADIGHSLAAGGQGQATLSAQTLARLDCLGGGTLIWTAAGPMPVERIQVGDLVLAQDADSGELAYQPVLRTTVRPPGPLVQFEMGNETIHASGGHTFWVAGEGWVKARDLKPGMTLHTVDGTVTVGQVQLSPKEEQTYNLVVANFNTYFVGKDRVLSHDNTIRKPTDAIVPGLVEQP